jgi:ABC-type multidrug transport system ATPase subunit
MASASEDSVLAAAPKSVGLRFVQSRETGILLALIIMVVLLAVAAPEFRSTDNLLNDARHLSFVGNPESVASAIVAAQAKGIPVITFDSDALKSKRTSFVGTNNLDGGETFKAALPQGGTYAIIIGGLAADNLNERIKGFRSAIGSGFKEVPGSPYPCDDSSKGIQLIQDILAKNPNLSGILSSGGWRMFAPKAYKGAAQPGGRHQKRQVRRDLLRRAGAAASPAEGRSGPETSEDEIVRLMVRRDLAGALRVASRTEDQAVVLSVQGLSRAPRYEDVSFELRRGEIVGLAGLVGAGRSEMALGIFGAPPPDRGEVRLNGSSIRVDRPRTAMRHGIGLVPQDRKLQGLVLMLGVGTNLSLAAIRRLSRAGMIDFGAERDLVGRYMSRLRVKAPSAEQVIGLLSGSNQQKVALTKWLATHPAVLIVDEPTRGVDAGTKAEIYALMRELAAGGLAILVSSDLPEVLTISDRILVTREGRMAGELSHAEATEERTMALAALEQVEAA